jgi:acyl carrier protein
MDFEQIENRVIEIVSLVLKSPVHSESSRDTQEQWDSLKQVEIIFALEDEFDLMFDEEALSTLNSVQKISRWINDNA